MLLLLAPMYVPMDNAQLSPDSKKYSKISSPSWSSLMILMAPLSSNGMASIRWPTSINMVPSGTIMCWAFAKISSINAGSNTPAK